MSATPKQRVKHSLTLIQSQRERAMYANVIEEFREDFEAAANKLFKGKHVIEVYPSSIVASTNKRQLALRVDATAVSLEKQLFIGSGCKSFITQGKAEVRSKLNELLKKD